MRKDVEGDNRRKGGREETSGGRRGEGREGEREGSATA